MIKSVNQYEVHNFCALHFFKYSDDLKGKWIATIENQNIYQIDGNNESIGGKEDYILECDGKGNYTLILENKKTITGKYIIEKNNRITFKDDSNFLVGVCELSTDSEIVMKNLPMLKSIQNILNNNCN